ncbi:MAG: S46 family peptidase [Myxococcales bacterium]|nr:S46 family peptidase [Myxococcales bacterium]
MRRALLLVSMLLPATSLAGEGKWMPQQVLELGPGWVKQQGFGLPLDRLWSEKAGGGLLSNAVQLPGCSGSFVSAQGLLITNHHCVVGILQEHSTPQANLTKDGYLARAAVDEKPAKAFRVQVPRAFRDVTKDVLAAIPKDVDDLGRFKAVEAKQKALVAECEIQPGTRCVFGTFDGGRFFTITEFTELTDVRLVYAPPGQVGDFGGEVDNWMWPRHSGDFALLRVYEGGKPYQPKWWFPVSTRGLKPGDAVAVLGYPGVSFRAWLADEVAERQARFYPQVRELSAEWVAIMEAEGKKSPEVAIATADDLRALLNRRKNSEGQLAGLARGRIVEGMREAEARVEAFAKKQGLTDAVAAHDALAALHQEKLSTWDRDFLLDTSSHGARAFGWPLLVARRSWEAQRPDAERELGYQERDLPRLRERLERDQKRYAPTADFALAMSWLRRALALPKAQRIETVDTVFGGLKDEAAVAAKLKALIGPSKLFTLAERMKMFDEGVPQLMTRKDPLLDFALGLDVERRRLRDRREAWAGRALQLRPRWRAAVLALAARPVAPDANSTLRVTFGRVRGYSPRDGVTMEAQTSLAGVLEKHTGVEPFDVPLKIREAVAAKKPARFVDPRLKDVPVDFLADCDTTGGNSGSPVIDGQGRLVGVNFDRVWENVANDFGYNPAVARNVSADVRYLLWLLAEVEGAGDLLKELGAD